MPTLSSHWDGAWIPVGDHVVKIVGHKMFEYHTGTAGVEFALANEAGLTGKMDCCLHEKAIWKLAGLARDLGFSKDEMQDFEIYEAASYTRFHGRKIGVTIEKPDKYHEVTDWWPPDHPPKQKPARQETASATEAEPAEAAAPSTKW